MADGVMAHPIDLIDHDRKEVIHPGQGRTICPSCHNLTPSGKTVCEHCQYDRKNSTGYIHVKPKTRKQLREEAATAENLEMLIKLRDVLQWASNPDVMMVSDAHVEEINDTIFEIMEVWTEPVPQERVNWELDNVVDKIDLSDPLYKSNPYYLNNLRKQTLVLSKIVGLTT
jgi:hypothetical protein